VSLASPLLIGDASTLRGDARLIKRIKRVGFGFRRFAQYRLRVLLYAGRPNWNLIDTIDPAQIR
jgi:hypothetical protein